MAPAAGAHSAAAAAMAICSNATYANRIDNPDYYNWCVTPNTSYDVTLFGGLAVVLACLLQGKLNTLMVLCAGAAVMAIAWPVNLGALGNSLAIWLGISPWQLFFYVFLPPLLLDAAVRIDWFMFKKSVTQVFTLAFLVVGATCVAMVPMMLYILDLRKFGWNWLHACMFGAMIASTDAVAIVAVMKTSGGPKRLRVILEGESLLNDASGLTLFEVFFHILQESFAHPSHMDHIGPIVGQVFLAVVQLGLIGLVMGYVFGVLTRLFLRFMRYAGAGHDQEVALTLGMAYLAYWVTGVPCKGSGVVAVAVLGLYGASTNCWDMSTAAHHTFDGFWETLAFVVNSLVFMYSGVSVVNFFIRAYGDLAKANLNALETTLWMLPIIFLLLMALRFVLVVAFRPLFIAVRGDINMRETTFLTMAGLRGSASLIMGSAVVTQQLSKVSGSPETFSVVKSMMVFWTAGFVLLTLLINAPLLPTVLRLTGLSKVSPRQLARRQRAVEALAGHSRVVLEQLRDAEDELLAGVDWAQVAAFVDHGRKYAAFTGAPAAQGMGKRAARLLRLLQRLCCCCCPCLPGWRARAAGAVGEHTKQCKAADSNQSHHGKRGGKDHQRHGGGSSRHGHSHHRMSRHASTRDVTRDSDAAAVPPLLNGAAGAASRLSGGGGGTAQLLVAPDVPAPGRSGGGAVASDAAAGSVLGVLPQAPVRVGGSAAAPNAPAAVSAAAARLDDAVAGSGGSAAVVGGVASSGSSSGSAGGRARERQRQQHQRRRRRPRPRALQPHVSGDVSDDEESSNSSSRSDAFDSFSGAGSSSSSGSGSHGSSSGSSSSSSSSRRMRQHDSTFIDEVLPMLHATSTIDVMQQECPFLGSRWDAQQQQQQQQQHAGSGSCPEPRHLPTTTGQRRRLQQQALGAPAGARWWQAAFWKAHAPSGGVAGADGGSAQHPTTDIELQQHDAGTAAAAAAAGAATRLRAPSAFAAAAASRTTADASAGGDGVGGSARGRGAPRPATGPPPSASSGRAGAGALRSLATRSAAPVLAYGGGGTSAASAAGAAAYSSSGSSSRAAAADDCWPAAAAAAAAGKSVAAPLGRLSSAAVPGHRRKGSDSSIGMRPGKLGWGLAGDWLQPGASADAADLAALHVAAAGTGGGPAGRGAADAGGSSLLSLHASSSPRATSAAGAAGGGGGGGGGAGAGGRAPLVSGTEKALGRTSGMYRSLVTRSTTLADRYGGGSGAGADAFADPFAAAAAAAGAAGGGPAGMRGGSRSLGGGIGGSGADGGALGPPLSRVSSEMSRECAFSQADGECDAAAIAVDMVALARSSSSGRRPSSTLTALEAAGNSASIPEGEQAAGADAAGARLPGAHAAGMGGRALPRGLSARSVGLAGAYGSGAHPHALFSHASQAQRPEPDHNQQGSRQRRGAAAPAAAAAAAGRAGGLGGSERGPPARRGAAGAAGALGGSERGLSTRSNNPHLPPVGPVAPSLYTLSTGLAAAYNSSSGGGRGGQQAGPPPPAAAAAAAAAAASARDAGSGSSGGLPWVGSAKRDRSLASRSVPAAGLVAAAAAAGAAAAAAASSSRGGAAAAAGGGGGSRGGGGGSAVAASSASTMLAVLRGSFPVLAKSSAASGKSGGAAATPRAGMGAGVGVGVARLSNSSMAAADAGLGRDSAGGPLERLSASVAAVSSIPGFTDSLPKESEAELADARSWLVTGLKRYFHAKRMEGLLSARGLRILDSGCDELLEGEEGKPLQLWAIIRRDCANSALLRLLTYVLFGCRQAAVALVTLGRVGRLAGWPLRLLAGFLQRPLNKVLLSSVEVAMEYLMGLTTSPYVEWLQEGEAWSALLAEISSEAGQVAQFLIDREIEAPERYSAVQSYRVAMAVLRQQRLFVETLFESGMLDGTETGLLSSPIEAAERRLELLGPVWRAPSLLEVLRQLPFMRGQPQRVLDFLVRYGHLTMFDSGSSLPAGKVLYVVQSGIVKVSYAPDLGPLQEYFLGAGGLFNLYGCLTGESLPGETQAVAQGNALGRGPVLFVLGAKGLRRLAAAAASGDPAFQQMELDMYRLAGLFLLERLRPQFDLEVSQALARVAPLTAPASGAAPAQHAHTHAHDGHASHQPQDGAAPAAAHRRRSSKQQRAAWVRQRLGALRALLRQQLVAAELLELDDGASVTLDGHALLMRGSIQVTASDDASLPSSQGGAAPLGVGVGGGGGAPCGNADVVRWLTGAGRHQHQSILPWVWDVLSAEDVAAAPAGTPQQPPRVTVTAGWSGATLLVCPSATGAGAELLEEAAAAAAVQQPYAAGAAAATADDVAAAVLGSSTVGGQRQQQQQAGAGAASAPAAAATAAAATAAAAAAAGGRGAAGDCGSAPTPAPGGARGLAPGSSPHAAAAGARGAPQLGASPAGPGAGMMALRHQRVTPQNTYSRCSLASAAAAAADAFMDPLPGTLSGGGLTSAAAAAAAAAAGAAGAGMPQRAASVAVGEVQRHASRTKLLLQQQHLQEQPQQPGASRSSSGATQATAAAAGGELSPAVRTTGEQGDVTGRLKRVSSTVLLAGAQVDNAAALGVVHNPVAGDAAGDLRLRHAASSPGVSHGGAADGGAASAEQQQQQQQQQQQATAARQARQQRLRRSASQRPLKGGGGMEGLERRM